MDADLEIHKVFVIGDPHFKSTTLDLGRIFIEKCISQVESHKPDFICVLGDILDSHEIVRIQPHKLACEFLFRLSRIAHVFLLIGNHDYINNSQFQTDNHIFTPLKLWEAEKITIVDRALIQEVGSFTYTFCPYVPPGKFVEALDSANQDSSFDWRESKCIFAHQEIRGSYYRDFVASEHGDIWSEEFPPVISGHIHIEQTVGTNVYYVGSPMQHAFGECTTKYVWVVEFDLSISNELKIEKIDLDMRQKRTFEINSKTVRKKEIIENLKNHDVRLEFNGTPEEYKTFRESKDVEKLLEEGNLKIRFVGETAVSHQHTNFRGSIKDVMGQLAKEKSVEIQKVLSDLFSEM